MELKPFMAGFVDMINFEELCQKTYSSMEGQKKEEFHQTLQAAGIPVTLKECLEALEKIKPNVVPSADRLVPPDRLFCVPTQADNWVEGQCSSCPRASCPHNSWIGEKP